MSRNAVRIAWLFCAASTAFAQKVTVDWANKKISSQPTSVEKETRAAVELDNVNDLMYTYSVSYTLKPLDISDYASIAGAFTLAGRAAAGEAAACDASEVLATQKALTAAETAFVRTPATAKGCSADKPCSIPLEAALAQWRDTVAPPLGAAETTLSAFVAACPSQSYSAAVKAAAAAIADAKAKYNAPHIVVRPEAIVLSPEATTTLRVDELWQGTPTVNGSYTVDIQPSNHRLALSAGALFSEIQNRSYSSRSAPNGSGETGNVLAVDGLSRFSPTAIALLNYSVPFLDSERIGLALSTGPVFRLGSKSDTSSFGYFAGASVHLYHRFYLSPGFHFGQFADWPAGFNQPNQPVPEGLATPTGTNRWTWRFGFALTYKTRDFSQFGVSGSVTPAKPDSK